MLVSKVYRSAAMPLLVGQALASQVESLIHKGEELLASGFAFRIWSGAGIRNDLCHWFSAPQQDEPFACFDLRDAGGKVLICFAQRDVTHNNLTDQLYYILQSFPR